MRLHALKNIKLAKITKMKKRSLANRLQHIREDPACWKEWPGVALLPIPVLCSVLSQVSWLKSVPQNSVFSSTQLAAHPAGAGVQGRDKVGRGVTALSP